MQQAGGLKKRQRRNLTRVNGLTNIPNFEGEDYNNKINSPQYSHHNKGNSYVSLNLSNSEFSILRKTSGEVPSSRTRPTRNPIFHQNPDEVFDIEDDTANIKLSNDDNNDFRSQSDKQNQNTETIDRPYLIDAHSMSRLKQIMFLGMTSGAFPWKWDVSKQRIDNFPPLFQLFWQIFRAIFVFQSICLGMVQIYTFWQLASSGKLSNRELFMTSVGMFWYLMALDYAINMYIYGEHTREYINTLLQFNYDMVKKHVIHLDGHKDGGGILINFSMFAIFNIVLIQMVYFIQMPFAPWYLFSHIYPKPWYWLLPGILQTYWLAGQVITSHTLTTWMVVAHTNTMQFWLTEIHNNNGSDYTSDAIRKRTTSFYIFKSLRVLNNRFNDCVSPLLLPMTQVHTALITILNGYVTIRNMNSLFIREFPQSLLYPTGSLACVIDNFEMMNMSAQVYDLSCGFIHSWSVTRDNDLRKKLLSTSALKIQWRRFYFISVSTTIKFFQIVWDLITDAIISFQ